MRENLEGSNFPGDEVLKREARMETAKKITGKDTSKEKEIELLRTQYETVMREYREARLLNKDLAEELIDTAEELLAKINKIDPNFDWGEWSEDEARLLNKKAFKKPMN